MTTQCYCTALRRATRRVAALYDDALGPTGVNIAQFALLRAIARTESVSLTELGKRTELDRSTVGRNVRVLERMGHVATSRGQDQREATVALSAQGRRVLDEGAPLWDGVQTRIARQLETSGGAGLREILERL